MTIGNLRHSSSGTLMRSASGTLIPGEGQGRRSTQDSVTAGPLVIDGPTAANIKIKLPKLLLGPLEIGTRVAYEAVSSSTDKDEPVPLWAAERLNARITVKDSWLRGKFEFCPNESSVMYSKKFRIPGLNTELLKLSATVDLSQGQGMFGHLLGLQVRFGSDALHTKSIKRSHPVYSIQMKPKIGEGNPLLRAVGLPGSIYCKPVASLQLNDANKLNEVKVGLAFEEVNLVVKLYNASTIKPSPASIRLRQVLWGLADRDHVETEASATSPSALAPGRLQRKGRGKQAVSQSAVLEVKPLSTSTDFFDAVTSKGKAWAQYVASTGSAATRHLQDTLQAAIKPNKKA